MSFKKTLSLMPKHTPCRGGKAWIAVKAKSFEIVIEEKGQETERVHLGEVQGSNVVDQVWRQQLMTFTPEPGRLRKYCTQP